MTIQVTEVELTPEEIAEREQWAQVQQDQAVKDAQDMRRQGYQIYADPVFFKWQRGEATKEDWDAARAQVEADFPIPVVE